MITTGCVRAWQDNKRIGFQNLILGDNITDMIWGSLRWRMNSFQWRWENVWPEFDISPSLVHLHCLGSACFTTFTTFTLFRIGMLCFTTFTMNAFPTFSRSLLFGSQYVCILLTKKPILTRIQQYRCLFKNYGLRGVKRCQYSTGVTNHKCWLSVSVDV